GGGQEGVPAAPGRSDPTSERTLERFQVGEDRVRASEERRTGVCRNRPAGARRAESGSAERVLHLEVGGILERDRGASVAGEQRDGRSERDDETKAHVRHGLLPSAVTETGGVRDGAFN